jgi:PAS domain S-box-containing protein
MAVAMIGLVGATAGSVAWLANRASYAGNLPAALDGLGGDTRLLASALQAAALGAGADVLALGRLPTARELADAPGSSEAQERLAVSFAADLDVKRRYLQLRFLDVEGREVVRVDRSGPSGSVRVVPSDGLQDKGSRPYVGATLSRRPGVLYVSEVDLNEELGVVETPFVPVVRLATPVARSDGEAGGLIIVNMDLRPVFDVLRAEVDRERELYIWSAGDYLVHPDTAREFARARHAAPGTPDDISGLLDAVPPDSTWATMVDQGGGSFGLSARAIPLAGGPRVVVALTQPEARLLAARREVVRSALIGGSLLALIAMALAAFLARSLARPVMELARSVSGFEATGVWNPPARGAGELGVLSDVLGRAIRSEHEKQRELEHEVETRRRAESALAREASQLRLLSTVAQSSLDGIYTMTVDGVLTSWNPGAERLYGYRADEVVGRHVEVLVPDTLKPEVAGLLKQLGNGEAVRDHETVRLSKEGVERDVSLTLSPVRADAGTVVGITAIARDIGERKALEDRFRLAVEASPNGMVMVNQSGEIVLVNREVERLFGYSRDELLGASIDLLVPESSRNGHPELRNGFTSDPHRRAMGSGRDLFGRRKDGAEIPVEIGLNPFRTPEGLFVLAAVVDISERVKAEEELRRSNEELEQFAYVASHDLQEPLRMVASYTELLGQRYEGELDERADMYIHYAVDGARRMQLLINDLLRFSRINSEAKPLAPTDLARTVREVVTSRLAGSIRDTDAAVEIGALPVVLADEVQMGQVFQNLISNALKFRAEGRRPVVRVDAARHGRTWRFSVADNGIGIDAQYADRVFEMFQRLHGIGTYAGSGIGLTLARKIVHRHGGSIWFDSVPGSGTTFHFTLPADES